MTTPLLTLYGRGRTFIVGLRDMSPSLGKPLDSSVAVTTAGWLLRDTANAAVVGKAIGKAVATGVAGGLAKALVDALQSGKLVIAESARHPTVPFVIKKDDPLTLSEVSWGETAGLYPTITSKPSENEKFTPSKWDDDKLALLQKARAAVHDVANRNSHVHKSSKFSKSEEIFRPYHCIENFPALDTEIDQDVKWFYISNEKDKPEVHPGTTGTKLVKSYGEFFCNGGGDVKKGGAYLLFYKLAQ